MIELTLTSTAPDTVAALRNVASGLESRLEQAVESLSDFLNQALQDVAPVSKPVPGGREPGVLRESIRFDVEGLMANYFAVNYVEFVIGGTVAHVITGNPLHFYWDKAGGWVTFTSVHHPGTKPNDFRLPAIDQAAGAAEDELEAIGDWVAELFS